MGVEQLAHEPQLAHDVVFQLPQLTDVAPQLLDLGMEGLQLGLHQQFLVALQAPVAAALTPVTAGQQPEADQQGGDRHDGNGKGQGEILIDPATEFGSGSRTGFPAGCRHGGEQPSNHLDPQGPRAARARPPYWLLSAGRQARGVPDHRAPPEHHERCWPMAVVQDPQRANWTRSERIDIDSFRGRPAQVQDRGDGGARGEAAGRRPTRRTQAGPTTGNSRVDRRWVAR